MALRVKIIPRPKDNTFFSKYLSGVLFEIERKTIIQCISLVTIEIIVMKMNKFSNTENRININCEFTILSLQKSYIYFHKIKLKVISSVI